MDNIGVNYRPIKSFDEFLEAWQIGSKARTIQGENPVSSFEFRYLKEDLKTKSLSYCEFVNYIEELRTSSSFKDRYSLCKVPEFTSGIPSIELSAEAKTSNATSVLNFLIEKGGVFVMLPPQERVKEVPNE